MKSKEIFNQVLENLKMGLTINDSLEYCGCSRATYYSWMKVPKKARRLKRANLEMKRRNIKRLEGAGAKDWRASLEILSRRFPDEWGNSIKQKIDAKVDQTGDHSLLEVCGFDKEKFLKEENIETYENQVANYLEKIPEVDREFHLTGVKPSELRQQVKDDTPGPIKKEPITDEPDGPETINPVEVVHEAEPVPVMEQPEEKTEEKPEPIIKKTYLKTLTNRGPRWECNETGEKFAENPDELMEPAIG